MTATVFEGVIRGKVIELDQEPGLAAGETVRVMLLPNGQAQTSTNGETPPQLTDAEKLATLKRLAGAWAEDAEELDKYMEWNRQQRKVPRAEIAE